MTTLDEPIPLLGATAHPPPLPQLRVGGERTDEIHARLATAVVGADVLIVQGGINDVVQGRAVKCAAADLLSMVRKVRVAGLQVAIAEVLPWNNGWPDAEPAIRTLNEAVHRIAGQEGIRVLPFYETLQDPGRPGRMAAEWTADGNHPSVKGHRRLGEIAWSGSTRPSCRRAAPAPPRGCRCCGPAAGSPSVSQGRRGAVVVGVIGTIELAEARQSP